MASLGVTTGGGVPVTVVGSTLPSSTGVAGVAAGTGFGALAGAGVGAFALMDFLTHGPSINEQLNSELVQPFQIAAHGITDSFTDLTGTMIGEVSPAIAHFDKASYNAADGVLVLGNSLTSATATADGMNNAVINSIQIYDAATGSWVESGIAAEDLTARMWELHDTTNMSTEAIARMVAEEAGIPSISDELVESYKGQKDAMLELAETSSVAAQAFEEASGDISRAADFAVSAAQTAYDEAEAISALHDLIRESAGYALGGVPGGPGISAYSNQVVSKPTLFPFGTGIGLMGEQGAEAIMPLSRDSSGRLGVKVTDQERERPQVIENHITLKLDNKVLKSFVDKHIVDRGRRGISANQRVVY